MADVRTRVIFGCSGLSLTETETSFFSDVRPWGFILFARNIADPVQVRALVAELRATVGDANAPVLIDQEGGRVARLKAPHWRARPPAAVFGELYARNPEVGREACYLNTRLIAHDLYTLGINVDCLPVLDVPVAGADNIIGDRAYACDPATIISLGRTVIDGMIEGGVLPVMKHVPGHGRATLDSHKALPRVSETADVLSASDFVTFRSLNYCPLAMTAHVVYEAFDAQRPATLSPRVVRDVIRGEIGFDGVLMSDDVSMGALEGPIRARTRAALFAGCDVVLHCNGNMAEMQDVAVELKPIEDVVEKRIAHIAGIWKVPGDFDPVQVEARLAELLEAP